MLPAEIFTQHAKCCPYIPGIIETKPGKSCDKVLLPCSSWSLIDAWNRKLVVPDKKIILLKTLEQIYWTFTTSWQGCGITKPDLSNLSYLAEDK